MFWANATSASLKLASALSEAADPVDEAVTAVVCGDPADESEEEDEPQPARATAATITTEEYPSFTAVPSDGELRHSVVITDENPVRGVWRY